MWAGEGQREKDTETEAGSGLQAVSTEPDVGLEPMNREIMTWTEVWCLTNWATQAAQKEHFKIRPKLNVTELLLRKTPN